MRLPVLTLILAATQGPLVDVDGPELMSEIRRSSEPLIVVNVWATWCGPCVRELPMLFDVEKRFQGKVRFIFVSADFASQRADAAKLLEDKGAKLPCYFKHGKDQAFIEALHPDWNGTLPATFVFDREGRRLRFWQGAISEDVLVHGLQPLL